MSLPSNQVYRNSKNKYEDDLLVETRASYNLASDQVIANGGLIDVPLTETKNETNGAIVYAGAGNFTITEKGIYSCDLICTWGNAVSGELVQYIFYPNDSGVQLGRYAYVQCQTASGVGPNSVVSSSATFLAKAGDTFTIKAGQTTGGNLTLTGVPNQTSLLITRLA